MVEGKVPFATMGKESLKETIFCFFLGLSADKMSDFEGEDSGADLFFGL